LPTVVVPPTPPTPDPAAIITLGGPGEAVHMTALGTVVGLDLMHPRPGSPMPLHWDTPVLIIATAQGWHVSGAKTVRDGIALHPSVSICRADLLDVGTVSIRTVPVSANLLGTITLGERSTVSLRLDDSDGYWSRMIGREGPGLIGCNAGIYQDFSDAVLIPMLVGTVGRFHLGDGVLELDIGDFKRVLSSGATTGGVSTAFVNLDDTLELRTAAAYSKPANAEAVLPRVYGDFQTAGLTVPEDDDDGGFVPAVSINTDEWVYCIHDGTMPAVAPEVYVNQTKQSPSVYEWHPNEDYQGVGVVICYIKFLINPGEAEISTRMYGQTNALGGLIQIPLRAIQDCFIQRGSFASFDFDPTTCEQTARDQANLGWQVHWVFNEQKTYREWLNELAMNYQFDHLPNAYGQLAITQDRSFTQIPVQAIADIDATVDLESFDQHGTGVTYDVDEANLINAIELEWQYDWTSGDYTETVPVAHPQAITLHDWRARAFSLRGVRTLLNMAMWTGSVFARYSFMPGTVQFTVPHLRYIAAQPGTYLALTWPRHAWSRRLVKVLNVEMDVMNHRMTWECMDVGRNAADPLIPNTPQVSARKRRRTFRIFPRFRGIPLTPLGLSLGTGAKQGPDGTTTSFVRATWQPVPQMHLTNYVVRLTLAGSNSAPLVLTPPIEQTEATFEGLPGLVVATVRVAAQGGSDNALSPFGPPASILTAPDTTPPSPPSGLVAVGGLRAFVLAWNESPERDVLGYTVWASPTASIHEGAAAWSGFASRTLINATGTTVGTTFHFWIQAFDRSKNVSAWHPDQNGPGVQATLDGISVSDLRELHAARTGSGEDNMLMNGGGEAGIDGIQAPYWVYQQGVPLVPFSGDRKYGERCLLMNNTTTTDALSLQNVQVFNNEIYEASGWIASGVLPSSSPGLGAFIRVLPVSGVTAFHILKKHTYGGDPTAGIDPSVGIVADNLAHGWTEVFCRFRVSGDGILAFGPQVGLGGGQFGFVMFDGLSFRRLHRQRTDDLEEGSVGKVFSAAGGTGSVGAGGALFASVSINATFQTGIMFVVGKANVTIPNGATAVLRVRQGLIGTIISEESYHNASGGAVQWNLKAWDMDILPAFSGVYSLHIFGQGASVTVNSSSISVAHEMRTA
jgi:hypothetical protein